jgi:hypothetical protein
MVFDQRFKVAWDESVDTYRENLPWILIGLALFVGTVIVLVVLVYLEDFLVGRGSLGKPWSNSAVYARLTNKKRSYFRLFMILLMIAIFLVGMTCAANIMSINFWSIILGYGILAAVVITTCGEDMKSIYQYIKIASNARLSEGQWILFEGTNMQGKIVAINILYMELEYINEKCEEDSIRLTSVPLYLLAVHPITRLFAREEKEAADPCLRRPALLSTTPSQKTNASVVGLRLNAGTGTLGSYLH